MLHTTHTCCVDNLVISSKKSSVAADESIQSLLLLYFIERSLLAMTFQKSNYILVSYQRINGIKAGYINTELAELCCMELWHLVDSKINKMPQLHAAKPQLLTKSSVCIVCF